MNNLQKSKSQSAPLTIMLTMVLAALVVGCDGSEQATESTVSAANGNETAGSEQPLGDVAEFDGFTIRANVSPTEHLPDEMAEQYDIDADSGQALLTVVVLETQTEQQPMPVSVDLSAHYESLTGQTTDIDMRAIEADGRVSYIGTLDTSTQRVFQFVIEAQPEGTEQPLQMNFDVELPELNAD